MKKYRPSDVLLSFTITSGFAFVGTFLFASLLCFQTPPEDFRKNGVRFDAKVIKKTRNVALYSHTSSEYCYINVELIADAEEKNPIRVPIGDIPFRQFKEGEVVPVWYYNGAYRVDKYGAMDIISPWPFFTVSGLALVLFVILIRKYRSVKAPGSKNSEASGSARGLRGHPLEVQGRQGQRTRKEPTVNSD